MKLTQRLSFAPLALAGLLFAPPALALQGGVGGPGGAGGTYTGPGDTVPDGTGGGTGGTNPGTPPPPIGGPGDFGAGPGGTPVAPTGPPVPGMPPPGAAPAVPPDEPSTPDGQPPVADPTSWQLWWHYNRWDYLPVGRAAELLASTGAGDFFLGRGQVEQRPVALRATANDVTELVQPALLEVLEIGGRKELVVYALQALAKLRDYPVDGDWNFNAAARHYLRDGSQEISEGALLALGIRGEIFWEPSLVSVLADTKEGRELLGRSKVGHRLRAFAAYSLALIAERQIDPVFHLNLYRKLAVMLPDERPEVQGAILVAMGFCGMPVREADASGGSSSTGPVTLAGQIQTVAAFLADRHQADVARSQAPFALAHLAAGAPEPERRAALEALIETIGTHAKTPTEVRNGAVLALGDLGMSTDGDLLADLERVVVGAGADRLTRYLAMISMARAASRPGVADEPLAGMEPTRRFLTRQLERNRGMQLAWTALALGVLEESSYDRGEMPSPDAATALRDALRKSRNADVVGAVAIALGMLRDREAREPLLERLEDSGSSVLRGYAALALGMIGAESALEPLRELLAESSNRPGSLQRVAIGLSLLGDGLAGTVLSNMLLRASAPEVQASIAAALGWVKDPRPLPKLCERLRDDPSHLSRAWISVATGRISDPEDLPWNAHLMVTANYDAVLPTLRDPNARQGVVDYP
ncbi:MAG: HEAT repeat domain-containing protein [Planctomycetota bacterium]